MQELDLPPTQNDDKAVAADQTAPNRTTVEATPQPRPFWKRLCFSIAVAAAVLVVGVGLMIPAR